MEIVTIVLEGALEHKDSLGTGSVIRPGEIQRMSAGTGITHSEFNHSKEEPVHLYQIWILPEQKGLAPGYEQITYKIDKDFTLIGSREGKDGAVTIHQDVAVYMAHPEEGDTISYDLREGRGIFLQVAQGQISFEGETFKEGDGLEIENLKRITLKAETDSKLILFDLA